MIIQIIVMDDAYHVIEKVIYRGTDASKKSINFLMDKYPVWHLSRFLTDLNKRWYPKDDRTNDELLFGATKKSS